MSPKGLIAVFSAVLMSGIAAAAQEQADAALMQGWQKAKSPVAAPAAGKGSFAVPDNDDAAFVGGAYRMELDVQGATGDKHKDKHRDVVNAHIVIEASVS